MNLVETLKHTAYINARVYERNLQEGGMNKPYTNYCLGRMHEVDNLASKLGIDVAAEIERGRDEVLDELGNHS